MPERPKGAVCKIAGDAYEGSNPSPPTNEPTKDCSHVFLLHIVTHAAQQQADAATLLSMAGQSPGETTFLEFMSSR